MNNVKNECDTLKKSKQVSEELGNAMGLLANDVCEYISDDSAANRVKQGHSYWYINECGSIESKIETFSIVDQERFQNDNYYIDYGKCHREAVRDKLIKKINKEIDRLNQGWKPDWTDYKQYKYFIEIYHSNDGSTVTYDVINGYQCANLFNWIKSDSICRAIIETYGKEIKYVLGVINNTNSVICSCEEDLF